LLVFLQTIQMLLFYNCLYVTKLKQTLYILEASLKMAF
jgi:hypothetical protein